VRISFCREIIDNTRPSAQICCKGCHAYADTKKSAELTPRQPHSYLLSKTEPSSKVRDGQQRQVQKMKKMAWRSTSLT
jgi:hypothetical protein